MRKLLLALALGCAAVPMAPVAAAKVEFATACDVPGAPTGAKCGVVRVPEDRSKPKGRSIPLSIVLVPGEGAAAKADPLLIIPGGPGQSGSQLVAPMLADLLAVAGGRPILFLDQRGTGRSNPLDCPDGFEVLSKGIGPRFDRCLALLQARADLRHYGSANAVQDIEAVRSALGYERLNLVAASYGVRVASAYMREHPRRVRSATLRAAYAPDYNIIRDGLGNADRELGRVIDGCMAEAACAAAFPRLEAQLQALDEKLGKEPARLTVKSAGGAQEQILVGRELLQQILYAMLLSAPTRQMLPLIIDTASRNGFEPLAPMVMQVRDALYGALPVGMYLSVVCSEDAARLSPQDLSPGRTPLSKSAAVLLRACDAWPKGKVPASFFAARRVEVPTLIISGELDPATTVAAADRLAALLPQSRHVALKATSHGPLFPPCLAKSVAAFIESASAESAAADCSNLALAPFALAPPGAR